ncbi:MAG: glycosyltransferase [Desulfamplus sp.]|nr:glycosyltransferase [Desulfamplus sp.]
MLSILHVIQKFSGGGADRAMVTGAKYSSQQSSYKHSIISLKPVNVQQSHFINALKSTEIDLINGPNKPTIIRLIENADIVHVHFWNNPQLYAILCSELPAMRLLINTHINGWYPPQVITKKLIDYSDFIAVTSPYSFDLPVFQNLSEELKFKKSGLINSASDFSRLAGLKPRPHKTFNVGYIGTVDFIKMHPNYIFMSARIDVPDVRFIVCGEGSAQYQLRQQANESGSSDKFEFMSYTENIKFFFESLDVLGYPLCSDNYSTSELVLHEAMYAGVPAVVFPYGGAKYSVIDNYTGLIVRSELEYKQAIEYLYHHPNERIRLGQNARNYARQVFGGENSAKATNELYDRLMRLPKRKRKWDYSDSVGWRNLNHKLMENFGSRVFIQSLGENANCFIKSVNSRNADECIEAEKQILQSSPVLRHKSDGGILHYRNYYQEDAYLNLWTGLVFQREERWNGAVSAFRKTIALGCEHPKLNEYLAQVEKKAYAFKLKNIGIDKIIIFGTAQEGGKALTHLRSNSYNNKQIIFFSDNNIKRDGSTFEGKKIIPPEDILNYEYDLIVIAMRDARKAESQLRNLGINDYQIAIYQINHDIISFKLPNIPNIPDNFKGDEAADLSLFIQTTTRLRHIGQLKKKLNIRLWYQELFSRYGISFGIESGYLLRDMGYHEEAFSIIAEFLTDAPNDYNLLKAKGAILAAWGKYDDSLWCFRSLLSDFPHKYDLLLNISDVLRYAGDYDESLNALDKLDSLIPNFMDIPYKRLQCLRARRDNTKAMKICEHILGKNTSDWALFPQLCHSYGIGFGVESACLLKDMGHHKEALSLITNLLTDAPVDYNLLKAKGEILASLGKYDDALDCFNSLQSDFPHKLELFFNISNLFYHMGRNKEAHEVLDELKKVNPKFPGLNH